MDSLVLEAHDHGPEGRQLHVGGQRGEGRVRQDGALDGVVHLFVYGGEGLSWGMTGRVTASLLHVFRN